MSDLVKFLFDRLNEDARLARAVQSACRDTRAPWPPEMPAGYGGPVLTEFLKHFSEGRMLREAEAGFRLLAAYDEAVNGPAADLGVADALENVIRDRAAVYSDHPDYRQEWAQ